MAKKRPVSKRQKALENKIKERGVHLAYEKLQFAGLRLKSGLCLFKGEYYLFIDMYKTSAARIELLQYALEELDEIQARGETLFGGAAPAGEEPEPVASAPESGEPAAPAGDEPEAAAGAPAAPGAGRE